ncbi:ABC transporter ATP-binding protein [Glaciimonas sp. PCH181]|uniref:ABC transporter ATP-binding protein n=1 Tax=Glaciimonas sp. PCH181 TaxID=2133943 RepID=UPI000D3A1190|nr:ABC transporter ATP-binding protein [Glaciimonas sp. PCH181]PUA19521.1 ABC transporter ATP-binding protein [Glaciimonas sp. PCH181]
MAAISLNNISKGWDNKFVIKDLSLEIHDREFLVLLGPSGCGKTTTMRMIAGLEQPTSGHITMGGSDVTHLAPRDRDISMVFQNYGLYPHMTVQQNISYPLRIRKVPRETHAALIAEAARKVELEDLLDRKPKQLSGGQRQRVALARAIVRQPQVFLMDEPLSNLDAKLRISMRARIKHLQYELGTTMVYVTHDQIEAMTLATRVVVMYGGVIQQIDTPENIYNEPANLFVADFIGSPAMNLLSGRLENGDFVGENIRIPDAGKGSYADVVLGVRWEDIILTTPGAGQMDGEIYTVELIGDATQVTVQRGKQMIVVRTEKTFKAKFGEVVGLSIHANRSYLFDAATQQRLIALENRDTTPL